MSIFFSCECGNQLKAREEMAGRLSFCPKCGTSVRIPPLEPTHSGIEHAYDNLVAHGSTRVQRSQFHPHETGDTRRGLSKATHTAEAILFVDQSKKRKRKKKKKIEFEGWWQRLIFPLRDYKALLGIAGYFTLTGCILLLMVPDSQQNATGKLSLKPLVWGGALPFFAIGVAYCCVMFNRVLFFTLVGYGDDETIPEFKFSSAIDSFLFWGVSFFVGPVVLFLLALLYWVQCGQIDFWDIAIMGELLCGGFIWWILTVLGNHHRLQKLPLNPLTTYRALNLFGWKAAVFALVICPILIGIARLGIYAVSKVEQNIISGVFFFFVASFLFLYSMQIALRTVGISYYKAKTKMNEETDSIKSETQENLANQTSP